MRITIDQSKCIGSGHCVMSADEVFAQRPDDGIVVLLDANPTADLVDDVWEAADTCPARAIIVDDSSETLS